MFVGASFWVEHEKPFVIIVIIIINIIIVVIITIVLCHRSSCVAIKCIGVGVAVVTIFGRLCPAVDYLSVGDLWFCRCG